MRIRIAANLILLVTSSAAFADTIVFGNFTDRDHAIEAQKAFSSLCKTPLRISAGPAYQLEVSPSSQFNTCFRTVQRLSPKARILRTIDTVNANDPAVQSRKKVSTVPAGFEDLLEPQTTEVDVYFGGVYLRSTLVTYTPTEITFLQPAQLVAKIPDLLRPDQAISSLASELPTNTEFLCLKSNQWNCGKLDPESLEVVFNESLFRVDLFIAPALLAVRDANVDKFLPPSSAGASLLHQINATYTGAEGEANNYNIGNATTLSFRETRLLALSNVTGEDHLTVDTLAVQREISGRLYQAGYFRSSAANLVFVNETDFAGFTIGSSLDTRTDLDQSAGNDLQLFLDSRSRVDILKDGRLVSTHIYEAGNQILDTGALPGGAYDVLLRIRDNFGRVREEIRFYVKTNDIPPLDHTLYFLDFGELVTKRKDSVLPDTNGKSLVRAGISKRLSTDFGGQLGFIRQQHDAVFEAGLFKLGRFYDFNLNLATGNNSDRGVNFNARLRAGRTTLHTNLRRTWTQSVSLMGRESTQANVSLNLPLGRGYLSITGRYNRQLSKTDRNIGLRYDFTSLNYGSSTIDFDFQITRDNDNLLALFGVRFSRATGRWRNEIASQYYYDRPETVASQSGLINNLNTAWNDGNRFISDVTWNMRAVDGQDDSSLETDLEVASDLGRLNVDASYSGEAKRLNYGANLNTTFIANTETIAFGGRNQARSALVMDIEGDIEDAWFDVQVNGAANGSAKIGTRTVVGVQPFETYQVGLIPRGESLVDFNDQIQTATVYPGNVVTMKFRATRVLVAFGQIKSEAGQAIPNALIEGVHGLATTDEFGLFQAELDSSTRTISVRTRTSQCSVNLPEFDPSRMVVSLGVLTCR